jgi:hypothetical protein
MAIIVPCAIRHVGRENKFFMSSQICRWMGRHTYLRTGRLTASQGLPGAKSACHIAPHQAAELTWKEGAGTKACSQNGMLSPKAARRAGLMTIHDARPMKIPTGMVRSCRKFVAARDANARPSRRGT